MDFSGLNLFVLTQETIIKPFDCGESDLNEFLFDKSKLYSKELLSTTYILEDSDMTLAFFSLFNDSLRVEDSKFASVSSYKRFLRKFVSHSKRHLNSYPAIKIGRLAVNSRIQKSGIGKTIISFIIDYAMEQNSKCACKLIIVDAYRNALSFYERFGFEYLSENDSEDDTRQMYLDLTPFLNSTIIDSSSLS